MKFGLTYAVRGIILFCGPAHATEHISLTTPESWKASRRKITDKNVPWGTRTLKLESTRGFSVGDQVIIHRPCTRKWLDDLNISNTGDAMQLAIRDLPWLHNEIPAECLGIFHLPVNDQWLTGWVLKLEFDNLSDAVAETTRDTDNNVLETASKK